MKTNKVLKIYAVAVTGVALLMTYNTVKLVDSELDYTYQAATTTPAVVCPTLEEQLTERAYVLREENKNMDLERYRQEAIREVNINLQVQLAQSPFIDYEELENKYGY